jgi:hypothetical protein
VLDLDQCEACDGVEVLDLDDVLAREALGFLFALGAGRGEVLEHAAPAWPAVTAAAERASSA